MNRLDLSARTVLLTGATGGLGKALAAALAARGARLALLDLDLGAVRAQAALLGNASEAHGWAADVRSYESLREAIDDAARHFGGIDVAIANAGIDTMAPMALLEPAAFDRVIDVNLNGVWRTFRAALPHVEARQGHLLAISSLAAFAHSPLQASYTASKAGVWAMCNSIRLEVKHLGVTVGSVHPTFFRTPLLDEAIADPAGRTLWRGNRGGLFATVAIERVVRDIVHAIEQRRAQTVIPSRMAPVAWLPGVFRRLFDLLAFPPEVVRRSIELSSPAGWNDDAAVARQTPPLPPSDGGRK